MKRSEINHLILSAKASFEAHGWTLPPNPKWDVTDFGLGDWRTHGLVLVNLAEEPEYCEKLMYARKGMVTPAHTHFVKKEDIISRWGTLRVQVWLGEPGSTEAFDVQVNGEMRPCQSGDVIDLPAGHRITLTPGIFHEFFPLTDECVIGEVSTANDDVNDNIFFNKDIGRFAEVEEDESAVVRLVNE